jgi:TolB-like protein/Flp pilus assembly protein TadD
VDRTASAPPSTELVKIRQQLERILASKSFRQVDRLQRFLSFIVTESLAGSGDNLKEYLIGVEVFGKEASFDPRMDPIVRVQARRLRIRLTRYYREEGQNDAVLIELPKGGYAPLFQKIENAEPRYSVASVLSSRNTIMIAPFVDDSHDHELAYFCRGLTEEIVHTLTNVKALRVIQWTPGDDRQDVPHSTNAAMRISGNVRRTRNILRITVHLVDAASRRYLWSTSIDRQLDDSIALQEEVARLISEKLQGELGGEGHAKGDDRPTENLAAYNFYLQGRHRLAQRSEDGLRKAVEFFDKAIAEDPQYAQAYSGLADAHGLLGHYGVLSPLEVCTKAASAAAWSVLLDDDSVEAHTSLAHTKATQDWDFMGAEREFQRAISLDPRYATAHHWYCTSCLLPLGRLDDSLQEIRMAQALDPISSIIARDVAMTHYYRRDLEVALEQSDRVIEQNPHFEGAYWTLGLIQEQRGDLEESAAAFRRGIQLAPHSPRMRSGLARTLAVSGRRAEAFEILSELQDLSNKRYVSPFELASVHFALGHDDEGYEWLTRAFQSRCFELIFAKVDPRVDSLRGDARFKKLFAQLGFA